MRKAGDVCFAEVSRDSEGTPLWLCFDIGLLPCITIFTLG